MAFDFGAGISAAGTSVAQTAQAYTLEAQKADLEKEKVMLADQLQGQREERGREFTTSERVSGQQFQGEQTDKKLASDEKLTKMHVDATLGAAGISAGASLGAAKMHADSVRDQIAAENDRASSIQMNPDGTAALVNKVTGKVSPLMGADNQPAKFKDPDQAKAQLEAVRATSSQLGDLQRKYQTDAVGPRQALLQAQKDPMLIGDAKAKAIEAAKADIAAIDRRYEPEFMRLNSRMDALSSSLADKGGIATPSPSGRPPLADFNRTPAPAPGLINSAPP